MIWLLLLSCRTDSDAAPDPYDVEIGPYSVDIRTTSYGVPHILAEDMGSAGYGMGYALAQDHGCVLADQVLKVKGRRSAFWGPGDDNANLHSDFGWLHLGVVEQAEAGFLDMSPELQSVLVGYAAGFNRALSDDLIQSDCRGEPWVKEITHIDLLAYHLSLGLFGSGAVLLDLVSTAQPPNKPALQPPPPPSVLRPVKNLPLGSNGWAIGSDKTASGGGALLSNTHFPFTGERQWSELHVTVPGVINAYGASLVGVPAVNVGFNDDLAWTHTVSYAARFTAYMLQLDPDDPTVYLDADGWQTMDSTVYTIDVLQDGELVEETRELYRTRWGPMLNAPTIGWADEVAFTYRDANDANLAMVETWFRMDTASSLEEFQAAHVEVQGIPWVHTLAASADGRAWYIDSSTTPNLSDAAFEAWEQAVDEDFFIRSFADFGVYAFPAEDPVFEWMDDDRARGPGLAPVAESPMLERSDFLANANQSHWMSHPDVLLEGYAANYGGEREAQTPRTRMNMRYLEEASELDLDTLSELALSGRVYTAEIMLDDLLAACPQGHEASCQVLEAWDRRVTLDSRGAHLWREFVDSGVFEIEADGDVFATPFDPDQPMATPTGLGGSAEDWSGALTLAEERLAEAGIPLDARLGDIQFQLRGDTAIPIGGGRYEMGPIQIATWSGGDQGSTTLLPKQVRPGEEIHATTDLTTEGYFVNNGNSYVLSVVFEDGVPSARAIMVYGQSEDPESPHFTDQPALYGSEGQLREVAFTEAEIAADLQEALLLELE